jgi:hypothetical protein
VARGINSVTQALTNCVIASALPPGSDHSLLVSLEELSSQIITSYETILSILTAQALAYEQHVHLDTAIGGLAAFFRALLQFSHQEAWDEISRRQKDTDNKKRKPKPNTKAIKALSENHQMPFKDRIALLTNCIQRLITSLDLQIVCHSKVFVALFGELLEHLGSTMSVLVFTDPRQPASEDDVNQPRGIQKANSVGPLAAIATAELEGPCLIMILKPVLEFIQQQYHLLPIRSRESISGDPHAIDNKSLLGQIEKRVQHTLLQGVFGDDGQNFKDAFARAQSPAAVLSAVEESRMQENPSSWFIGQVWELLGWNVLSGRTAASP